MPGRLPMPSKSVDAIPAIEGYFRRTQTKRFVARILLILALAGLALAASATWLPPLLILPVAVTVVIAALLFTRTTRTKRVKVRLENDQFSVSGDGFDIQLRAPFRCKTGVERILTPDRERETCFVRIVIDVHGKPLVLEEQVLTGDIPPPLDEIVGISSALGVADLTSLSPYPGPLWALIQQMRRLERAFASVESDEEIQSLNRLGERQLSSKRYVEAIATYSAIIRQAPNSASAYFGRGTARYYAGRDLDKAVNDLTTTLRLDPRRKDVYRMRALARAALGDWTNLRDDCSAALQFPPQTAELYNLRGNACYRLEDYAGALADFESAIELEPGRPESYYNRGLARQQIGRRRKALADFEHALRLDPEFEPAARSRDAMQRGAVRPINSKT